MRHARRYGKGTGFEDSTAILKVPDLLQGKRTLEVFDEGEEEPAFWNLLGGWSDYVCNQQFLQKYREKARLFCFSNQTGTHAAHTPPHTHAAHTAHARQLT